MENKKEATKAYKIQRLEKDQRDKIHILCIIY